MAKRRLQKWMLQSQGSGPNYRSPGSSSVFYIGSDTRLVNEQNSVDMKRKTLTGVDKKQQPECIFALR